MKMASEAQEELQRAKEMVQEYQQALELDKMTDSNDLRLALQTHYSPEISWYGVEPFNALTGIPYINLNDLQYKESLKGLSQV